MELEPERMTELRAFLAARVAMVLVLVVLPPVMELMILELRELITEDAAFETARCATLLLSAASFSFCFCAASSPFWRCFSAASSSRPRYFSAAFSSLRR